MSASGPVTIQLDLPADANLIRLARLVVSGVASTLGMRLEDVESCRAAIDELSATLLEVGCPEATLHLKIFNDGPSLVATGEIDRDPQRAVDSVRDELSRMILSSVVDAHEVSLDPPTATFRFRKHTGAVNVT